jgi:hypothetical protein
VIDDSNVSIDKNPLCPQGHYLGCGCVEGVEVLGVFAAESVPLFVRSSSSRTIVTSGGALIPIFTRSPSTANTEMFITPARTILSPTFRRKTSM